MSVDRVAVADGSPSGRARLTYAVRVKVPKKVWIPAAAVILFGIAAAIRLIRVSTDLYNGTSLRSEQAAALQAIASAVGLVVTIVLVAVTAWYGLLTRNILRQAGPLVSADLRIGWLPEPSPCGPVFSGVFTATFDSLSKGPPDSRTPVATFSVTTRNAGNAATNIMGVSIAGNGGVSWVVLNFLVGTECPFRLESHVSETRCVEVQGVLVAVAAYAEVVGKKSSKLRAVIELGGGDVVYSKWRRLPAEFIRAQGIAVAEAGRSPSSGA